MINTVGQTQLPGNRYSSGIGYIAIPSDYDRTKYIKECFMNNRVSMQTEDGGFYNQVNIDKWLLNFIDFPEKVGLPGSPVVYVTEPIHQKPIIISVLNNNDTISDLVEHQFKIRRSFNNNFVEISASPKVGYINLCVDSDDKAEINVSIVNSSKTAELNINTLGNVNFVTDGELNLQQNTHFVSETKDFESKEFTKITQTKDTQTYETPKFVINEESEPFVLGNKIKNLLDNFIEEVSKITVPGSIGRQPIFNKLQVQAFKNRTEEILSEVAFLDK